jgi:hypothetical protein
MQRTSQTSFILAPLAMVCSDKTTLEQLLKLFAQAAGQGMRWANSSFKGIFANLIVATTMPNQNLLSNPQAAPHRAIFNATRAQMNCFRDQITPAQPFDTRALIHFFEQLWKHSSDPFWICKPVDDDFELLTANAAAVRLDARQVPGHGALHHRIRSRRRPAHCRILRMHGHRERR